MKYFCQKCGRNFEATKGRLLCDACLLEEQKELKIKMAEEELNRKKAEEHFLLVQQLRKCLIAGQASFLLAGRVLCRIKNQETYKAEDFSREITWEEFLMRPDLPFPTSSRNQESIRRMADRLIGVYETFIEKFQYKEEELASIGFSKLALITPVVKDLDQRDNVVPWIDKAKELTVRDLITEIRTKDKTLGEILECQHRNINEVIFFRCLDCGMTWKYDPRLKK